MPEWGDIYPDYHTSFMKCPIPFSVAELLKKIQGGATEKSRAIDLVLQILSQCEPFVRTVVRLVRDKGGNLEDGQDMVQESLIQLMQNLQSGRYDGLSSVENYALGIVKNRLLNFVRKKRETPLTTYQSGQTDPITSIAFSADTAEGLNPEQKLHETERSGLLWQLVGQLSGRCPQLLTLWAKGLSHAEIAAELGMSEKKAKERTYECRKDLREHIAALPGYRELLRSID